MSVIDCRNKANSSVDRTRGAGACGKASRVYKKGSVVGHKPGRSGDTATTAGVGGFTQARQSVRDGNVFIHESE